MFEDNKNEKNPLSCDRGFFQIVDKVIIKLSLCIIDETLCRGYFYLMEYVIIKKKSSSINKNLSR